MRNGSQTAEVVGDRVIYELMRVFIKPVACRLFLQHGDLIDTLLLSR